MDNPGAMEDKGSNLSRPATTGRVRKARIPNRWIRWGVYLVAALIGLWGLAWLAVPPLLKWQGQKIASEQLGRKVTIGAVELKPWSMELVVRDLAMASADGTTPQFSVKRLYANAQIESLWRLAPVVDGLQVDEPHLRVTHLGDGHYDFDDVLNRLIAQPQKKDEGEPARFALYNIDLKGGSVDFDDQAVHRKHEVRDLGLTLPFISNLPSKLKIKVRPHLAFVANGSHFDSTAQSLPFAQSLETTAHLKLAQLDLAPYIGYIPAGLPIKLKAAMVDADLNLSFEQTPKPSLKLGGGFEVSGLDSVDTRNEQAVSFDKLKVGLAEVRPLEKLVRLSSVELEKPHISIKRDETGLLNLQVATAAEKDDVAGKVSVTASLPASGAASGVSPAKNAPAAAWQVAIESLAVHGGTAQFKDDTPTAYGSPAAQIDLHSLEVQAQDIGYPFAKPLSFKGSAVLAAGQQASPAKASAAPPSKGRAAAQRATSRTADQSAALAFEGTATDQLANVTAHIENLPLALASPYVAQALIPQLSGQLDAQLGVVWAPNELKVNSERLKLSNLLLAERANGAKTSVSTRSSRLGKSRVQPGQLVAVKGLELVDTKVDLLAQAVSVGKLNVSDPDLDVERDAKGRWMYEPWLRQSAASEPSVAKEKSRSHKQAAWKVVVDELAVQGGRVGWRDASTTKPVRAELSQLKLNAGKIDLDAGKPINVSLSTRLGAGRSEPGRLSWQGSVGLAPLAAKGSVDAQRLPVHAFEPYFGDALNIDILRADASFKGQVAYTDTPKGPQAKVAGDALIEELRTHSRALSAADASAPETAADTTTKRSLSGTTTTTAAGPATPAKTSQASQAAVAPTATAGGLGEEFLSWKRLRLTGVDVALEPQKPAQVEVKNTLLSDFYARLIIHSNGRINLQDIVKSTEPTPAPVEVAKSSVSAVPSGMPAAGESSAGAVEASAPRPAASAAAPVASDPNAPVIRFGPIQLANGKVLFSDRFIRPNYSADLTELNGTLSAFSSVAPASEPQMADLQLTGKAEGSAALEITGKLNPLAKPLALDIKGRVRDLELPPLSPYSVKYAGHGIERGKLSVDVVYTIQPDGRLTATNKLVLNQLEFGEAVAGAPASLPVKLATALLADSHGVIDLDLPISGSLNDPQFSLGPIIFKAIVNLIGRAITAPFTLLARALGGGGGADDLSNVPFAPGSATLSADARSRLDKIVKALTDRPALKLTVVGTANLEIERAGWRKERLKELVAAEKRGEDSEPTAMAPSSTASGPGTSAKAVSSERPAVTASAAVSGEEYAELLKKVYRRADLPGKPRNALGFAKNVPVEEMEALLLSHISVGEDAMRQLAVQRGAAVKDYLVSRKLPAERLFLGAAKTGKDATAAASAPASAASGATTTTDTGRWVPRAELNLSAR